MTEESTSLKVKNLTPDEPDGSHIHEKYSEIVHYTGGEGLQGILGSSSLWCTHYAFLNDHQEFQTGAQLISDWMMPKSGTICGELEAENPKFSELAQLVCQNIKKSREELFEHEVRQAIKALIKTQKRQATPYICSFCSASESSDSDNGLLSMWRGYGKEGGYGIVFDSEALLALIDAELEIHEHTVIDLGEVHYKGSDEAARSVERLGEVMIPYIKETFCRALEIEWPERANLRKIINRANLTFSMIKDAGFREECEARLVCSPFVPEIGNKSEKKLRDIEFQNRGGTITPYVNLFSDLDQKLPIKRIIVGPSPHTARRCESVTMILKSRGYADAEVVTSQIPFVELG